MVGKEQSVFAIGGTLCSPPAKKHWLTGKWQMREAYSLGIGVIYSRAIEGEVSVVGGMTGDCGGSCPAVCHVCVSCVSEEEAAGGRK